MEDTMIRPIAMLSLILCAMPAGAADWHSTPEGSKLEFVATFEEAPVAGEFKSFEARLRGFDPATAGGSIEVVIDTPSAETGIAEVDDAIQGKEWFDFAVHPRAEFRASEVTREGDGYLARGTLTLKGAEKPVAVQFTWAPSDDGATATGEFTLQRGDYGIGTGEWATADTIGAEVTIRFKVHMVEGD
jgi:polyisoprenoid-binding protein YceI